MLKLSLLGTVALVDPAGRSLNGDVGGNGPAGAQPANAPGDRGRRAADLLGELVGGLKIVVLH